MDMAQNLPQQGSVHPEHQPLNEQLLQGKNTSRWPQQSSKAPTVGIYIYIYVSIYMYIYMRSI